jgi:hypothetical protein
VRTSDTLLGLFGDTNNSHITPHRTLVAYSTRFDGVMTAFQRFRYGACLIGLHIPIPSQYRVTQKCDVSEVARTRVAGVAVGFELMSRVSQDKRGIPLNTLPSPLSRAESRARLLSDLRINSIAYLPPRSVTSLPIYSHTCPTMASLVAESGTCQRR